MKELEACTETKRIVPVLPNEVTWVNWKKFLSKYFDKSIPKIRKTHSFRFSGESPGKVFLKELVSGKEETTLGLFKDGVTADAVRSEATHYLEVEFKLPIAQATAVRKKQLEKVFKLASSVTGVEREAFFKKYL